MRLQLIILLLTLSLLHVYGNSHAQTVSLNVKNADLMDVIRTIEKQTGYVFWISKGQITGENKVIVTLQLKDVPLKAALDACIKGTNLTYEFMEDAIILKRVKAISHVPASVRQTITGKVTDMKGNPLPGVTVRVKATGNGTVTDAAGMYNIEADPQGVLVFTFVGYKTLEIKISGQSPIDMTMVENEAQLQETVVKGYYNTTKEFNTGNVTTIKSEDLARQPISDPIVALQGRVPGLFIQQTSGVMGREVVVRLRGQNSLGNGNEPLYIIDGIPFISETLSLKGSINGGGGRSNSPFNSLNINDIEKIETLKDADATAIYGSRGANGVILITTKKATSDTDNLDVNFYTGFGRIARKLDFLNLNEYIAMRKRAFENDNLQPGPNDYDLNGIWNQNSFTDWQDVLIGGTSKVNDLQTTLSGGSKQTRYRIGGTYRRETTVYPGDFFGRKVGFLFNLNHLSKSKKLRLNFSANYIDNFNNLPTNDFANNITLAPNAPNIYNGDGSLNWANQTWNNPLAPVFTKSKETTNNLIGNFQLSYELYPGLQLKSNFGYNKLDFDQNNITPLASLNPAVYIPAPLFRVNESAINKNATWIIEPQVSYNVTLEPGKLDVLLGSTLLGTNKMTFGESINGFSADALIENIAAGTNRTIRANTNSKYKYSAVFARLGYEMNEKYFLNLTARRDGSSRFGPGKRFGNFGAIGVAWIFSKEQLLKNISNILNFGKIRASYGSTGNDQIGDYAYLSTYVPYTPAYQGISSLEPIQHTNALYGWERVNKFEIAVDLELLSDKLKFSTSYYTNRTNNQLVSYALPVVTGFNSVRANLPATLQNSGLELELTSDIIKDKPISWTANFNISFPRNKLVSYPNIKNSSFSTRYAIGKPLSLAYLFTYTGIDPATGLYGFKDINGDRNITSAFDREFYFIGQKYYGGLQNNFEYKGFQLNFLFQFTKQNAMDFNQNYTAGLFSTGNGNVPSSALAVDRQPISQAPSGLKRTRQNLFTSSDGIITDASFIRLSNLSGSWMLPIFKRDHYHGKSLRLYVQCQNLLTITNYEGYDPEQGRSSLYGLPPIKMFTVGLQFTL